MFKTILMWLLAPSILVLIYLMCLIIISNLSYCFEFVSWLPVV
jgi:hypothetical protein